MTCQKCMKPCTTPISVAFDKFPGPLQPGKDFGICDCPETRAKREAARGR